MRKNSLKNKDLWRLMAYGSHITAVTLIVSGFSLLAFITGCGKEEAPTPQPAPIKKVVKPVQTPMTSVKKEVYVYNSTGKRDPFKPFITLEKKEVSSKVPLAPLQAYDVNELRLVGIILLPGKRVAMIEDPTGKGYNVSVGVLIGKNEGKVVEILKDEVVVEEKYGDEGGQLRTRKVSITLPKEKEGEGR